MGIRWYIQWRRNSTWFECTACRVASRRPRSKVDPTVRGRLSSRLIEWKLWLEECRHVATNLLYLTTLDYAAICVHEDALSPIETARRVNPYVNRIHTVRHIWRVSICVVALNYERRNFRASKEVHRPIISIIMLPKYLKFLVRIRIIIAFTARTIKKLCSLFPIFIVEKKAYGDWMEKFHELWNIPNEFHPTC